MSILKLLRGHIPATLFVFCMLGLQAFGELSLPRYMSQLVNEGVVMAQGGSSDYLAGMAATMLAFCVLIMVSDALANLFAARIGAGIARDLRRKVFTRVMAFSPAEVDRFSQASLITRCTNDVQQIQTSLTMLLRMVMMSPIMAAIALVQVIVLGGSMAWIIAGTILVVLGIIAVLFLLTAKRFRMMQKLVDKVNLLAREMLDGIITLRAFGRERNALDRFNDASLSLKNTQLFVNRAMTMMMPLMMLAMNVTTVIIVWFGATRVSAGLMQVGDIMAFISYAMTIVMSFLAIAMVAVVLPRAEVSVQRVNEVLGIEPSIMGPAEPESIAVDEPRGRLVFDHVSFAYPGAEGNVVTDISFTCEAGKTTAIVGSTGSGKSTLVQLAPRLYDPTEGSVTLDGHDLRNLGLADIRRRVGFVPQQNFLFTGTIRSNVGFAAGGASESPNQMASRKGAEEPAEPAVATDDDLLRAIGTAQATELVEQSPEGLSAPIAQGGTNVSGGQRQRLAIARALAAKPEVLVLDDSSSALDYATDAALRQALVRDTPSMAVLVVAQRVATVMHADTIIVLDEGRMVGRGTHEELLRTCPTYLEIAKSQLSEAELNIEGSAHEQ